MLSFELGTATVLFLLINESSLLYSLDNSDTLQFVTVLFRHGDRTNDAGTMYPKDPYQNETYYPFGVGQLTNEGKLKEYLLGKKLRSRYNNFLGALYTPEAIGAVSTQMDRTKMSLQLVLAGLYPPKGTLMEWEKNLDWQPISYNYLLFANDHLMSFPLVYCPIYAALYGDYVKSPEALKIEEKYSEFYPYLSQHTGMNVKSVFDVFLLYIGLTSQKKWGLTLPEWTEKVYPEYMYNAASDFYILSSGSIELKRLSGGFLLKNIITDMQHKLVNELMPKNRKIMLYSGHETNLAYLLRAMEVFTPHVPPYGACIMVELHIIDTIIGVKVYYEDYSGATPKLLTVPGCNSFCPLVKFTTLLLQNVPVGADPCGSDRTVLRSFKNIKKRYVNVHF